MKLIHYENLKLMQKRILLLLIVLLLVGNGLFFYKEQWDGNKTLIQQLDAYESVEKAYITMTNKEAVLQIAQQVEELELYRTFEREQVANEERELVQLRERIAQAKKEHQDVYERYKQSAYLQNFDLIRNDIMLWQLLSDQYHYFQQYEQKLNDMEERAATMLTVSIFQEEGSFSYRNIHKTVADFAPLKEVPLTIGLEKGIVEGTSWILSDLSMALIILLLCMYLFLQEKEAGLPKLIRANRYGREHTFLAKFVVLSGWTLLLCFLLYGSILLISNVLYGFGDTGRYIQSMRAFNGAVDALTVMQYVALYLLLKAGICLVLAWFVCAIMLLFQRAAGVYLTIAMIIGISFACYTLIYPSSYLNMLKYINLAAFMDTFQLLADYRNLNGFGYPIQKTTMTYYVGGGLLLVLPFLSLWFYRKDFNLQFGAGFVRGVEKLRALSFRYRLNNGLLGHEIFKLFITGKVILFVLIAGYLSYDALELEEKKFNQEASIYNRYLGELSGELTEAKLDMLASVRNEYDTLHEKSAKLYEQYHAEEIDFNTYNDGAYEIEVFQKEQETFRYVEKQRDELLQLRDEQPIAAGFVNVISSDELFHVQQDDLRFGIIFSLLLITGLSPLFGLDYRTGMMSLLRSTTYGRFRLFLFKYIVAYGYGIAIWLILLLPKYYNALTRFPSMDWSLPVQSIKVLRHVDWEISILQYVIYTSVLQLLGIFVMINIVLYLAIRIEKQAIVMLAATMLLVLPLSLQYIGVDMIRTLSLNPIFQWHYVFTNQEESYRQSLMLFMSIIMCIGLAVAWGGWKSFNSYRRRKG